MSIEKLQDIKIKVERELENFFDERINKADDDVYKEVLGFLKDYTLRGGKRIRVGMLVYGYGCFKEINRDIIKAAMVMELIQSYLLIHDDIMDKDDVRRGKDSMHVMYEKSCDVKNKKNKKHFGISMAICAGDLAASLANEIILSSDFENKTEVIGVMHEVLKKVVHGQMLEMTYLNRPLEGLDEDDIMKVNRLKTATYTVEGPLHIGALLAGADEKKIKPLLDYGVILGKAFQIRNDINDIFLSDRIGKSIASDLKEGKRTLLIVKALDKCNEDEKKFILDKLGTDLSEEDIEKFRDIIVRNSLDYCEELCRKASKDSQEIIKDLDLREEGKNFLLGITEFVATKAY